MTPQLGSPDLVLRTAPFGVRFQDPLSGSFVGDGLSVTAYPLLQPSQRRSAVVNRSGVYVFHDLPGLRDFAFSDGGRAQNWSRPKIPFRVEVVDDYARFTPFSFVASLPERGLFQLDCAASGGSSGLISSPSGVPALSLYSSPTRQPPASFGCVRADLWDPVRSRPAAWAVVEARAGDGPWARGMADERGCLAIFFPYPEPVDLPPGSFSSLFPSSPPLLLQSWPVELSAYYLPDATIAQIPDLCAKLMQSKATLWADSARSRQLGSLELKFGRALTVQTYDGGTPLSNLWVTSA